MTRFGDLVDGFLHHWTARAQAWGVEAPELERELVAGALAGMLNDGLIRGPKTALYEVHTERRPTWLPRRDTGTTETGPDAA